MSSVREVVYTDVYHPLTGGRSDVSVWVSSPPAPNAARVDGSELWALPGIYDADAHIPLLSQGLRDQERHSPRVGGVTHVNIALQWQELRHFDVVEVGEFCAKTSLPRLIPVLSVEPEDTEEFAQWLARTATSMKGTWPAVCKLYSPDPNFMANIDAVWEAGMTAVVYSWNDADLEWVAGLRGGPIHHRHARSGASAELMRSTPGATVQTSPHYLLELDETRLGELHVLPPVPGGADRLSLTGVLVDEIDVIATDDNAPVHGSTGPGLSTQRYFASAMLTLLKSPRLGIEAMWPKITTNPVKVFGAAEFVEPSTIIVDPRVTRLIGAEVCDPIRNPYAGIPLSGAVVALTCGDRGVIV